MTSLSFMLNWQLPTGVTGITKLSSPELYAVATADATDCAHSTPAALAKALAMAVLSPPLASELALEEALAAVGLLQY